MWHLLIRAAVGAATRAETGAVTKSVVRGAAKPTKFAPVRKPNKMLPGTRPKMPLVSPGHRTVSRPPKTGAIRPNPRINVPPGKPKPDFNPGDNEEYGNRRPVDRTHADAYRRDQRPENTPEAKLPEAPSKELNNILKGAALVAAAQAVSQNAKDWIPKIEWIGTCSARGFKDTPIRNVLHYCLAVVFGMIHQGRIGHTVLKVDTFPTENRVEVIFSNSTAVLLEPFNQAAQFIVQAAIPLAGIVTPFKPLDTAENLVNGIKKWANAGANPKKALDEFKQYYNNVQRAIGSGAIWEMGNTGDDIFAGLPPLSMAAPRVAPYSDMLDWTFKDKRPLLTKDLTFNPQGPEVPGMNFPTHMDLRSLVAQALYDPGVLPPVPDTVVAIPNVELQ